MRAELQQEELGAARTLQADLTPRNEVQKHRICVRDGDKGLYFLINFHHFPTFLAKWLSSGAFCAVPGFSELLACCIRSDPRSQNSVHSQELQRAGISTLHYGNCQWEACSHVKVINPYFTTSFMAKTS